MEKITMAAGRVFLVLGMLLMVGVISGTLLYWFWPGFAPVFHLPEITWGQAVCMSWCAHLLQRNNKSELKKD
jgi:hypothetical protein